MIPLVMPLATMLAGTILTVAGFYGPEDGGFLQGMGLLLLGVGIAWGGGA